MLRGRQKVDVRLLWLESIQFWLRPRIQREVP